MIKSGYERGVFLWAKRYFRLCWTSKKALSIFLLVCYTDLRLVPNTNKSFNKGNHPRNLILDILLEMSFVEAFQGADLFLYPSTKKRKVCGIRSFSFKAKGFGVTFQYIKMVTGWVNSYKPVIGWVWNQDAKISTGESPNLSEAGYTAVNTWPTWNWKQLQAVYKMVLEGWVIAMFRRDRASMIIVVVLTAIVVILTKNCVGTPTVRSVGKSGLALVTFGRSRWSYQFSWGGSHKGIIEQRRSAPHLGIVLGYEFRY